jgi:hypothetical protein
MRLRVWPLLLPVPAELGPDAALLLDALRPAHVLGEVETGARGVMRHVIPRLPGDKPMVGGPGHALAPVWEMGERSHVIVRCMCGHLVQIPTLKIDPTGSVWGEIECPTTTCGWHALVQLDDWAGKA